MKDRPSVFREAYQQPTARQMEILDMFSRGMTYNEVADALHISRETVKWHAREFRISIGVPNIKAACAWYGWQVGRES